MAKEQDTEVRYQCCEHCVGEGCPRIDGHTVKCGQLGCIPVEVLDLFGEDPVPNEGTLSSVENDILSWGEQQRIEARRQELIDGVAQLVGYEPPGIRVLLRVLSHPEIAGVAKEYFESMDVSSRCAKYEPPWSCAREAEAQYQNIKFGWVGATSGIGYDESWCEPCRRKVMGT